MSKEKKGMSVQEVVPVPESGSLAAESPQIIAQAIAQVFKSEAVSMVERAVQRAFEVKRDVFVVELTKALTLQNESLGSVSKSETSSIESVSSEWVKIESLSRLRALVGGRFETLKRRWEEAGFPLKEHRGQKSVMHVLAAEGWQELSQWIIKQGYEVRLANEGEEYFFQVRVLSRFQPQGEK